MGPIGAYPFERWARIGRAEARLESQLARALAALDGGAARADASGVLGAAVDVRRVATTIESASAIAAGLGASVALTLALGAQRAWIVLAPGIARVVADRAVGGAAADVALGPTPLSRGEAGLVAYVVARALASAGAPASMLDAGHARAALASAGSERVVVHAVELAVGAVSGAAWLVIPLAAIGALPRPSRLRSLWLPVQASLVIGEARLGAREVATLARGDIVVPDSLTLDPRVADVGRARLVIGRSSRTFELELASGAWRVVRPNALAAPRAPSRWKKKQRKDPSMSQPDTDTVEALSDVEVELSIELARLEMPVTEVATLAPGVVVTTGRLVGERVALRAGDRVIAWGELVDVEGEVGVRLTELAAG